MFYFRGLIPEFTHFRAPPNLRRKLTLALAFTTLGLVAGASGVALLVAEDDSDPRSAFALAQLPAPAEERATAIATIEIPATPVAQAVLPPQVAKAETPKPCAETDCDSGAGRKPEVALAVTAPPAAGDVPRGQSSEPAEAAPRPAALVANAPPLEEGTVTPANATAPASAAEAVAPARPAATPTCKGVCSRCDGYQNSLKPPPRRPLPPNGHTENC